MNDDDLYKQTLEQYNEPEFAKRYADNLASLLDNALFEDFSSNVNKAGKVLDIGCAAGRDAAHLVELGYQVTGLDLSDELLKIAEKVAPTAKFIRGDFLNMPFKDSSFDGLWCHAALVHLPSQQAIDDALKEFARIMKVGACITIITKAGFPGESLTAVKRDKLSDKQRYFRYQPSEGFLPICEKHKLEIVKHKVYNEKDVPNRAIKRDENWLYVFARKTYS